MDLGFTPAWKAARTRFAFPAVILVVEWVLVRSINGRGCALLWSRCLALDLFAPSICFLCHRREKRLKFLIGESCKGRAQICRQNAGMLLGCSRRWRVVSPLRNQ